MRTITSGARQESTAPAPLNVVSIAILIGAILVGVLAGAAARSIVPVVAAVAVGLVLMQSPRVAQQWERAIVLRLGRFTGLRGPGLFWIVPFVDRVAALIDQRTITTSFAAEQTLTSDTVPVNVDEILDRNQDQQNIVIFENDIIIVPRLESANPQSAEWVYVLGKVHHPGRVAYLRGRSPFTLTKLIAMCDDFQEFADRTKVKVIRTEPAGRRLYTVDFDEIISLDKADFELKPDDLVYVPETWI